MKIIFFISAIFFAGNIHGQDVHFLTTSKQKHVLKARREQLAALLKTPETNNTLCCCASISSEAISSDLNKKWLADRIKSFKDNCFVNAFHFNNSIRSRILTTYPTDLWRIEPVTQKRLNELKGFLKESKPDYRTYFN